MPEPKNKAPSWLRHSGVGLEFAAALAGFSLVGYWIDRKYGTGPWALIIGAFLGLIGGTYNLIRESRGAFKDAECEDDARRREVEEEKRER